MGEPSKEHLDELERLLREELKNRSMGLSKEEQQSLLDDYNDVLNNPERLELEHDHLEECKAVLERLKYANIEQDLKDATIEVVERHIEMIPHFMRFSMKLAKEWQQKIYKHQIECKLIDVGLKMMKGGISVDDIKEALEED